MQRCREAKMFHAVLSIPFRLQRHGSCSRDLGSKQSADELITAAYRLTLQLINSAVGSVSSRECLDAPAIFATFTAGRTGLVIV